MRRAFRGDGVLHAVAAAAPSLVRVASCRCRHGAEKLKRTGAVLSRQIASRRCCVRAARALLLGHRAVVAFWSVCCSVLRVWGRARSVPARRAQFFAAVLRSLRQSCHKRGFAIGARYRCALGRPTAQLIEWALQGASRPRGGQLRRETSPGAPGTPARGTGRRGGKKCRLSGLVARPMTQPDAYRAGRGLTIRLADPRRRRSAVLHEAAPTRKKAAHPAPKVPNRDRCCPTQRAP